MRVSCRQCGPAWRSPARRERAVQREHVTVRLVAAADVFEPALLHDVAIGFELFAPSSFEPGDSTSTERWPLSSLGDNACIAGSRLARPRARSCEPASRAGAGGR